MKREYWINVKHVDNRLVIFLNGETIWDSGIIHGDPQMDEMIEITSELQEHPEYASELIFEGFNDSYDSKGPDDQLNPWHFQYRIFSRVYDEKGALLKETDLIRPYDEKHLSNPNIKAIDNSYQLILKDGNYKVISNSLVQHFYE